MQDWKDRKALALARAKRIVVKVGSAVLTGKAGVDLRVVADLAKDLSTLHADKREIILVTSGAVAAGRALVSRRAGNDLPKRQAASAIGQSRLMHVYDQEFATQGVITAQILLTRDDLEERERYLNLRNTLRTLLSWRVVPIANENDTVAVQELIYGDNDCLAGLLVGLTGADLFVNLTSAKGVFKENPDENPEAECYQCLESISSINLEEMCQGKTVSGTGGMYSKLLAAKRVAQLGVPTLILSGREQHGITRVFAGEDLGTWVMPEGRAITRRKYWLAYNMEPKGDLWVDAGAAKALRQRGGSLLPAGITRVEGDFDKGSSVRILDPQGQNLGVGLVNYPSAELSRILGLKSGDIAEVLGHASYDEAVHRDNLLLDAALR